MLLSDNLSTKISVSALKRTTKSGPLPHSIQRSVRGHSAKNRVNRRHSVSDIRAVQRELFLVEFDPKPRPLRNNDGPIFKSHGLDNNVIREHVRRPV